MKDKTIKLSQIYIGQNFHCAGLGKDFFLNI